MSKILVVDDDREMSRLLKTLFELEGHTVTVARAYDQILPALAQEQPDIVLMDVHVQDSETIPLIQPIRQQGKRLPILMTSGMDRRQECMAAGADQFILKPFLPTDLINLVQQLLGKT